MRATGARPLLGLVRPQPPPTAHDEDCSRLPPRLLLSITLAPAATGLAGLILVLVLGLEHDTYVTAFSALIALQATIGLIAGVEGARRARRGRATRAAASAAARRAAAEEADRARARLLATTAYEIRTPLAGVIGLLEASLAAQGPSAPARQDTANALDAARDLAQLLGDLMEMPDGARRRLTVQAFRIDEVMEGVVALLGGRAAAAGLRLATAVAPRTPAAWKGDPSRIRQILVNLVVNALRFTESGEVRIEARETGSGELELRVSDTGRGIPPERLDRLFEPFAWAEGGIGLSLSISRDLAQRMGGRISVQTSPGRGSAFTVALPLPKADPSTLPAPPAPPPPPPAPPPPPPPVLVVDDVAANRLLLGAVLGRAGFTHEVAENGETALTMLASRPYAAVLMDVQMPGIDGLETTRRLRKMPGPVGRVPVIGVSAYHNTETEAAALGAGMDDFLAKPVSAADLVRVLPKSAKAPA